MNVIITGATGMVGEGVLLECLQSSKVSTILSISRKSCGIQNTKLKELIITNFLEIENYADNLKDYDACFYCAGKSSAGMTELDYEKLTYDTTIHFANILKRINPNLIFNFISGRSTDNTEKGKIMWARIKGKTENELTKIFANKAFHFRPALMKPTKGQIHLYGYNRYIHKFLYPILSILFPSISLETLGRAMINTATQGYSKSILEVEDIKKAAK
ncbi:NAD-dependent epimerase/dehydratase family protein [Rhizosphaericola mali]|uniref:NAD-dependent epimerase/dehydratase family protein n=1 Tax=Rhizosphaericola mali TaxID=2545455 RepID=A0A5P2FUV7_9BACT|nr:NAD-dependent epimerase/dehydratase family protein [Rhizosphaericola mali]QES87256.1 NAD-dependent epimerase/dehydratase family protein [Rhizosphaericola mali]